VGILEKQPNLGHILPGGAIFVKTKIQQNVYLNFLATICSTFRIRQLEERQKDGKKKWLKNEEKILKNLILKRIS
jgi:hypothetical protein